MSNIENQTETQAVPFKVWQLVRHLKRVGEHNIVSCNIKTNGATIFFDPTKKQIIINPKF